MNASTKSAEDPDNLPLSLWERLRTHAKVPLLIALSAAFATLIALLLWLKSPDYRVLYSNISDRDGGAIVTQLTQMNIPYRFSENGSTLLIPAEHVHETRLRLAQQGLPKGAAIGFELLDQEKFGISQFSEQINYQRALEGELSRTIESLGPVQQARVHLALPKPSLFVREQKLPSASVTLTLAPGRILDEGQINAVVYMVSSSVAGLPTGNIAVVDQTGRLLTATDSNERDLNIEQLKYANEVETRYQRRIEAILAPIVGQANVHAQVTAQIDFASREQTDEEYQPNQSPDKSAVRSKQLNQSEQRGGQPIGGIPGALSNQPSAPASAPIETPATKKADTSAKPIANDNKRADNNTRPREAAANDNTPKTSASQNLAQQTRHDETTNYEVDRTIRHTKQKAGAIERLSVAVVINTPTTEKEGQPQSMSKEQLAQFDSLVREAMGYSEKRGDSLNIVTAPFNQVALDATAELPFWKQPWFLEQLLSAGRYLLILLVAWLLWRKLVRPQWLNYQKTRQPVLAQPTDVYQPDTDSKKSQQRASVENREKRIRELANQKPQTVALIIQQWMRDEP